MMNMLNRTVLAKICLVWIVFLAVIPSTAALAQTTHESPSFLLGADISTLTQVEQRGGIFKDAGKPDDAIAIFRRHGWNTFRLRLFVNPNGRGGVINSLPYTIDLAKRIKASGATFILDIHYSDTWADPQHQVKPAVWKNLDFDSLVNAVEKYTADTITQFKKNDALPDIVQIGNEITGGTLWPDAQVKVPLSTVKVFDSTVRPIQPPQPYDDVKQWDHLTRILAAAAHGVREATPPGDGVRIMVHIDCGGDWPVTQWYFDHLQNANIDYDMIGQSFYPNWHGTLDNLRENLRETIETYHKPVIVVETAYPWKNAQYWSGRKNMSWPITAAGQRQFLLDLISTVRQAPDGLGEGVIYWHPESVPIPGPTTRPWMVGDTSLFDNNGDAQPAMDLLDTHQ